MLTSQTMLVEEAGSGSDWSWRKVDIHCCRALSSGSVPTTEGQLLAVV